MRAVTGETAVGIAVGAPCPGSKVRAPERCFAEVAAVLRHGLVDGAPGAVAREKLGALRAAPGQPHTGRRRARHRTGAARTAGQPLNRSTETATPPSTSAPASTVCTPRASPRKIIPPATASNGTVSCATAATAEASPGRT